LLQCGVAILLTDYFCREAVWHTVALWTWDAQDETCGICRMAFDGCRPDCICNLPGDDDCPLSKVLSFYFFTFIFVA
ncbi:hypothetical protein CARUB_v10018579mg, partial [Capsella rubella]